MTSDNTQSQINTEIIAAIKMLKPEIGDLLEAKINRIHEIQRLEEARLRHFHARACENTTRHYPHNSQRLTGLEYLDSVNKANIDRLHHALKRIKPNNK